MRVGKPWLIAWALVISTRTGWGLEGLRLHSQVAGSYRLGTVGRLLAVSLTGEISALTIAAHWLALIAFLLA